MCGCWLEGCCCANVTSQKKNIILDENWHVSKNHTFSGDPQITMSIKIGLFHEKKRTQNTKGPDVACGWSLILLAGGVKQHSALVGREGEEQKGLLLHDTPCIIPILLMKTPKHTTAPPPKNKKVNVTHDTLAKPQHLKKPNTQDEPALVQGTVALHNAKNGDKRRGIITRW